MEERHRLLLQKQNPHWRGEVIDTPTFTRDALPLLTSYLPSRQILAIVGMRRVGKTVLLQQLMKEVDVKPQNICYLSFDDRDFQKYETAYELVEYFLQQTGAGRKYLFLDEIQKVPDWQDLLKTLYDTEHKIKIVVSGSSSLDIRRGKETLAGRLFTFFLPVLTFREFVRYRGRPASIATAQLLKEYDTTFLPVKHAYEKMFRAYLLKGAFPELLEVENEDHIRKYVTEILDKIVGDAAKDAGSGMETRIHELLLLFCKGTGQLFELNNIAAVLKEHRNTIAHHVALLERAFVVKVHYNYTKSIAKRLRVSRKGYVAHSILPFVALNYPFDLLAVEGADLGHLVETAVASNVAGASFWRHQNTEVDFVLADGTPVEVKYQSQLTPADSKAVHAFMKQFSVPRGIVLTKDRLEVPADGKLLIIPVWLFLLSDLIPLPR